MGAETWEEFRGGGGLSQSDKRGEGFLTMSESIGFSAGCLFKEDSSKGRKTMWSGQCEGLLPNFPRSAISRQC